MRCRSTGTAGKSGINLKVHIQTPGRKFAGHFLHYAGQQLGRGNWLFAQAVAPFLQSGEIEQIVQNPQQPLRVVPGRLEQFVCLGVSSPTVFSSKMCSTIRTLVSGLLISWLTVATRSVFGGIQQAEAGDVV